jgi:hypothetical protein
MYNMDERKQRYLRDGIAIRLGGLAANLTRIKTFSEHDGHREAVQSLIEESKYFIEWTTMELEIDIQALLVSLQIQLALWQVRLDRIWMDAAQRSSLAAEVDTFSRKVLKLSGLVLK